MAEIGDMLCSGRKSKMPVTLEMMEYKYIDDCDRVDELRSILAALRSGEHGRYLKLEKHCEEKLIALLPAKERRIVHAMKQRPSSTEENTAKKQIDLWAESVKNEETQLQQEQIQDKKEESVLPPPRNQKNNEIKAVASQKNTTESAKEKKERLSGYDFRAWEKFDVDEACQEVDKDPMNEKKDVTLENKRKQTRLLQLDELRRELEVNRRSNIERSALANREKAKGNEEFRAGEFRQAYNSFSRSIAHVDTAIAYANRALACIKLNLLEAAEDDCSIAMRLDPAYTKAQARRGMIRLRRGKYELAIKDLDAVLVNHDLSNAAAIRKLRQEAKVKLDTISGNSSSNDTKSTEPLSSFTRIPVVECDDDNEEDDYENTTVQPPPAPSSSRDEEVKQSSYASEINPSTLVRIPITVVDDDDDDEYMP
mmetsp:Transcript_20138/g.30669  ORF Transcript_20138/g.30669 Transcript_20138/m.30669 type:complete len:425 (+) Transcript_20138:89-1363(+)